MKNLAKWISKNQGVFVALLIAAGVLVWTLGCESKVTSLTDPSKMVTADELNLEIEAESMRLQAELDQLMKRAELKFVELSKKDAIKQKLMDFSLLAAQTGTLNPSGLVGLIAGIVGIGAVIDNRIKDKVIKNRPLKV
ncbi:hypothetical protein LCGC14_1164380 [marine sediment metagenome]|uniref:Uncharacterized protein n=1 Tax=marine sediment metagenome TaxID=412755 RepID=A0A0F9P9Z2_9ZZZZ